MLSLGPRLYYEKSKILLAANWSSRKLLTVCSELAGLIVYPHSESKRHTDGLAPGSGIGFPETQSSKRLDVRDEWTYEQVVDFIREHADHL